MFQSIFNENKNFKEKNLFKYFLYIISLQKVNTKK